jgi:hypothetical protein
MYRLVFTIFPLTFLLATTYSHAPKEVLVLLRSSGEIIYTNDQEKTSKRPEEENQGCLSKQPAHRANADQGCDETH